MLLRDFKVLQVGVFVLEVRLVGKGSVVWLDWGWGVVLAVFVYDASDSCSHTRMFYFLPNKAFQIALPIFRSTPAFDVGMPVALAIFCLICVMPKARFHEKLSPGIGVDFFVMIDCSSLCMQMDSR